MLRILGTSIMFIFVAWIRSDAQQVATQFDLDQALTSVSGLPIEYRADLQLHILERAPGHWQDHVTFLQDLYDDTSRARSPFPMDYASTGRDNYERMQADGQMLSHLDTLSLRMRIIRDSATDLRNWTRNRLGTTSIIVDSVPCTSASVPILDDYYSTVGAYLFPHDRLATRVDIIRLEDLMRSANSAMQLPGIATIIAQISFSQQDANAISSSFSNLLRRTIATDREIGYLVSTRKLTNAMNKLVTSMKEQHVPPLSLLNAYHDFLAESVSSTRCPDSLTRPEEAYSQLEELFRTASSPSSPPPFESGPLKPTAPTGAPDTPMPAGPASDEILGKLYRLSTGNDSGLLMLLGIESRSDQMNVYGEQLLTLSEDVRNGTSACRVCNAYRSEKILLDTFDLLPDGRTRQRVLERLVSTLGSDSLEIDHPSMWYVYFSLILNMSRRIGPVEQKRLNEYKSGDTFVPYVPKTMQTDIRNALLNSHNAVMIAYATVDGLIDSTFTAPYLH